MIVLVELESEDKKVAVQATVRARSVAARGSRGVLGSRDGARPTAVARRGHGEVRGHHLGRVEGPRRTLRYPALP